MLANVITLFLTTVSLFGDERTVNELKEWKQENSANLVLKWFKPLVEDSRIIITRFYRINKLSECVTRALFPCD